jgi:hypothetical protein
MKKTLVLFGSLVLLSACQKTDGFAPLAIRDNSASVAMLQKVNDSAQNCWGKDKEFRALRIIPELDTITGNPRILVVEAKKAQGLPKLVIEAPGKPAKVASYGPLAQGPMAGRINSDVARWAGGNASCEA